VQKHTWSAGRQGQVVVVVGVEAAELAARVEAAEGRLDARGGVALPLQLRARQEAPLTPGMLIRVHTTE